MSNIKTRQINSDKKLNEKISDTSISTPILSLKGIYTPWKSKKSQFYKVSKSDEFEISEESKKSEESIVLESSNSEKSESLFPEQIVDINMNDKPL